MRTIMAYQFTIHPPGGRTSRACLDAVRDKIARWVCDVLRENGMPGVAIPFDGTCIRPRDNTEVWSDQQDCETHQLATLDWLLPSGNVDPALMWRFTVELACDDKTVEVALLVHSVARSVALHPATVFHLLYNDPMNHVPVLAGQIIQEWPCRIGGQPVPFGGRTLNARAVQHLVDKTLLNPKRFLPVIVLYPQEPIRQDVRDFQIWLLGLAEVVALADQRAVARLAELLGPQLGFLGGGLRVYWPGLTCHSPPVEHPAYSKETIVSLATAGQAFGLGLERHLMKIIGEVAAARYREGELIRAARLALTRDRVEWRRIATEASAAAAAALTEARQAREDRDRVRQQADEARQALVELRTLLDEQQARPSKPETDELTAELERSWEENRRLLAQQEESRRRLAELEALLRAHEENWAQLAIAYQGPSKADDSPGDRPRIFANVAEALQAAAAEFGDVLEVWDDASRSAAASPYATPAKVFQALEAIAEVGRAYFAAREGGPALGRIEQAFAARVPFKYTAFESDTTMSLYGQQRTFRHRGQGRQMQRHLTLGGGQTNNCLQIYFEFDDERRRVLIGYCGRHLPYHRQRT
jgi:hypothetical protein